tara:strand:+ start:92 stop:1477 length:1386 start_codon:yes stop_codon:yes gene_type:complete
MAAKNNDASLVKAALENWQEKEVLKNVQYKLPDIETNPNKIYRNYIKEGLQPDKFKTKEQLFEAVKDALNKTVNGKQVSMGQALKSLFPDGYEGIPLTYSKTGSSKKGNRVIKEVMFDKRAFREQIPLEIKQWFKLNQSKGLIPADSLEKYTKYINKGNTRNAAIAKRLSELTGIKFDKGHIFALFSDGTNDPAAQIAELLSENRGKGGVDNIPKNLADIIDTPKNWQQSAFEFVNRLTGGASGSGLPIDKFGKSLSDGDIASIARHGANPDQVVASKWKKVFDALSEAELAKANNTIPEFVNKFSNRIDESGKYVQKFGSGKPKVKGEIISINKKRALFASPVTKVAAVGIGFGLLDAFTGTQDAISGTHDYLNPKEETSDLERTADGLKAFSGALTAASPLVGATAIPAIGAKLSELHLRHRALKAKTRYDTIHDRTSTPTDLWIRKTNEWDQVQQGTL